MQKCIKFFFFFKFKAFSAGISSSQAGVNMGKGMWVPARGGKRNKAQGNVLLVHLGERILLTDGLARRNE